MVAGAYKGKVMQLLADMYPDYGIILGFEPQPWARFQAEYRLKEYKWAIVEDYGIGTKTGTFTMGEWETDGCSFVNIGESALQHGEGRLVDAVDIFDTFGFREETPLDLAVFNMEGYEFDLLPYMIEKELMQYVKRIAVQFHHGFGNDFDFQETLKGLSLTHKLVIDEMPQWGYWERRDKS